MQQLFKFRNAMKQDKVSALGFIKETKFPFALSELVLA